jgi:hypothetical protein
MVDKQKFFEYYEPVTTKTWKVLCELGAVYIHKALATLRPRKCFCQEATEQ